MKTPEEMAEEYAELMSFDVRGHQRGFLAGYKAAQDQVADASKVIAEDSCEHILDMEKMVDVNSSNNSNGWISVKEQMPAANICVLIAQDKTIWVSGYCDTLKTWGWYENGETCRPTHWMELPEPPKEEK